VEAAASTTGGSDKASFVVENNGTIDVTITGIAFNSSSTGYGFDGTATLDENTTGETVNGSLQSFNTKYTFDPTVSLTPGDTSEFTVDRFDGDPRGTDLTFTVYLSDGSSATFTITFPA